jgi:hypothetical protein
MPAHLGILLADFLWRLIAILQELREMIKKRDAALQWALDAGQM